MRLPSYVRFHFLFDTPFFMLSSSVEALKILMRKCQDEQPIWPFFMNRDEDSGSCFSPRCAQCLPENNIDTGLFFLSSHV